MKDNIIPFDTIRKKEVVYMCKILEIIKNKTAAELLSEYNISLNPPIDISELLEKIGISTIAKDFSEIEDSNKLTRGSIIGAAFSDENNLAIFYKKDNSFHRKKFTIAHELAHCCFDCPDNESSHIEYRLEPFISLTQEEFIKEERANIFAGQLLIPQEPLVEIYNKMLIPSLSNLAKIFEVSNTVMAARLDYLKMPYYKDSFTE